MNCIWKLYNGFSSEENSIHSSFSTLLLY